MGRIIARSEPLNAASCWRAAIPGRSTSCHQGELGRQAEAAAMSVGFTARGQGQRKWPCSSLQLLPSTNPHTCTTAPLGKMAQVKMAHLASDLVIDDEWGCPRERQLPKHPHVHAHPQRPYVHLQGVYRGMQRGEVAEQGSARGCSIGGSTQLAAAASKGLLDVIVMHLSNRRK